MKYLPFEDFEIETDLSPDEVFYRFRAAVDTKRKWWIFTNKLFLGEVSRHYFHIWRVRSLLRKDYAYVIGTINGTSKGCVLRLRMRMYFYNLIFWLVWLGAVWYMYFGGIASLVLTKIQTGVWNIDSPLFFLPGIGFFAWGYFIGVISFKLEAEYVKDSLVKITGVPRNKFHPIDRLFGLTESQIIGILFLGTFLVSGGWILYHLIF